MASSFCLSAIKPLRKYMSTNKQVSIRKFPYPYRCALALSNDVEYLTPKAFWDIHRYLNTQEITPMGPGLGLPITCSIFMYSVAPQRSFSYFQGTTSIPSERAHWLRDLMQIGIIDTLHAYGDFDSVGGFRRSMAEMALEELARHDIRLCVWTNHGGIENTQNIGASNATYQKGDLPGTLEYHTDLTNTYGFHFFWLDFNATNLVSQDRNKIILPMLHDIVSAKTWEWGKIQPILRTHMENRLLKPDTFRDGERKYLFTRYRGPKRPDPNTIPDQLSPDNMALLKATQGYMIIYQHLGCDRRKDGMCDNNAFPYFSRKL